MMTSSWIWAIVSRRVRHQNNVYDGGVGDACISAGMGPWMKDNFHPSFQPINGIVRKLDVRKQTQDPYRPLLHLNYSMHLLQYAARRTSGSGGMSTFEDSTGAL
jgi:hypothetical protein